MQVQATIGEELDEGLGARSRVVRYLLQRIHDGSYVAGQPLPSGRELSRRLQVNPRTVRNALDLLARDGVISPHGSRMRVAPNGNGTNGNGKHEPALPPSLMRNTVLILSTSPQEGMGDAVRADDPAEMGAFQSARTHELNFFALHPQRVNAETLSRFTQDPPFGVVISEIYDPATASDLAEQFHARRIPVVVYGDDARMARFDRVTSDHEQGCYELTRFLLEKGYRRPALVWRVADMAKIGYWFSERQAGYERALREAGIPPLPPVIIPEPPEWDEGDAAHFERLSRYYLGYLAPLLVGSVDGLLLDTDGHTPTMATACRLMGRTPQKDVALVGYDNYWQRIPERAHDSTAPLATVDKRLFDIGREMVELLVARMSGDLPEGVPQRRACPPRLVVLAQGASPNGTHAP